MDPKILEQRARAFDYLFDAVVVTDLRGIVIDWNAGAEQLYGYAPAEILGRPVSILHVAEDVGRITAQVFADLKRSGRWSGEIRMLRKDGSIGWVESVVVPVLDEGGRSIGAIGINRDISRRVETEEQLRRLAHYDPLTGLPNRFVLFDRLDRVIARAHRKAEPFAVLFIDLDGFKIINDSAGHAAGDLVLKEVAQRLVACVREADTVARVGGDEFVALVADIRNADAATVVAGHLLAALARPLYVGERGFRITASIGIATYPVNGGDRDTLLTYADDAMYRAKDRGKNACES